MPPSHTEVASGFPPMKDDTVSRTRCDLHEHSIDGTPSGSQLRLRRQCHLSRTAAVSPVSREPFTTDRPELPSRVFWGSPDSF
jgi:hypothetical protein